MALLLQRLLSRPPSVPTSSLAPAAAYSSTLQHATSLGQNQHSHQKLQPQQTTRSYWQEVVRVSRDPRDGTNRYEDPGLAAVRAGRAQAAEGLLRRRSRYQRYEKPWMKRKRLKSERTYRRKERGVEELKTYIKFMAENKPPTK